MPVRGWDYDPADDAEPDGHGSDAPTEPQVCDECQGPAVVGTVSGEHGHCCSRVCYDQRANRQPARARQKAS